MNSDKLMKNSLAKATVYVILSAAIFCSQPFLAAMPGYTQAAECAINSFTADDLTLPYNSGTTLRFSLSGSFAWSIGVLGEENWYNSAWGYRKPITIDHTKVTGTTTALSNFPILFSVTDSDLKTVDNGGKVGKNDGTDILFTGSNGIKLSHELEKYVSSTGATIAWVKIPALSPATDSIIYIYYGNASAADQQAATGVWDSNFKAVQHLPNGTSLTVLDSTSNANNGTATNLSAAAGQMDGAASFNGSSYMTYSSLPQSGTGAATYSTWIKTTDTGQKAIFALGDDGSDSSNADYFRLEIDNTNFSPVALRWRAGGGDRVAYTATGANNGNWHHIVISYGTSQTIADTKMYLDGSLLGAQVDLSNGAAVVNIGRLNSDAKHIGADAVNAGEYLNGTLDEVRISSSQRTAAWIATEYNNQSSPATFYSIASAQANPGQNFPASGTGNSGSAETGNITETQTYRLTCGADILDVSVVPYSLSSAPALLKSSNTALNDNVPCGNIYITLTDQSNTEDGWAIFRNTSNNPATAYRISTAVSSSQSATGSGYTYSESPADAVYYYWVQNYIGSPPSGLSSNPGDYSAAGNIPPSAFGLSPTACAAGLYSSDNDIVAINGANIGNGLGNQCGSTDVLPPNTSLQLNHKLKFSINLCNTGTATATIVSVTDTLLNLRQPPDGWNAQYCIAGSCSSITPTESGTAPNKTLTFSGLAAVPGNSIARITFEARVAIPAGFIGLSARFQNKFTVSYDDAGSSASQSGSTPLLFFTVGPGPPTMDELRF